MTETEGGQEQELVLGNKQLLSVFFIVVVLLGVFFTMGYIIGRNTGGSAGAKEVTADSSSQGSSPSVADARPEKQLEAVPNASTPSEGAANSLPPANPPPREIVTQPAKPYEESKAAGATAAPKPKREEKAAVTPPPVEKAPVKEAAVEKPVEKPPGGSDGKKYLQVMAVKRADAERVQKILQGQGFPTVLHESSKGGLYRVMVGPYDDRPGLSKAKDDLKGAGFDSIIAR
ncbi:MAG: SPOR domain-containing protein [Acidobacteriota bacterium]|nr:SPOR domain-containing protein [Acidobacteriota bacterium]